MNTLAKEIFKPKLFSDQHERFEKEYPGFHQMIYDSMDEYAKESYWQKRCEAAEKILASFPREVLKDQSGEDFLDYEQLIAASPSTASNEDKFIWTDELVKNYAECYRFSSSRISIEQFKKTGGYTQKVVNENYDANISNIEPKAVQQAAHKFLMNKGIKSMGEQFTAHQVELWLEEYKSQSTQSVQQAAKEYADKNDEQVFAFKQEIKKAFLAGASFNSKDEAKESDQDKYWSRAISMIEVADTKGNDYLLKYEELHKKLKSIYTISLNK